MKKGMIIALVIMSIGFAAVATTLTITGTIKYGYDNDDFDVIFSEAILDGVVNNDLIDTGDKKSITFTTKELSTIGDRSILEYQVMNNSKQYDATVTIECERLTVDGQESEQEIKSEYTEIKPSPTSLTVKAQESRKGTITVELKKVSTEILEEKFKCSLTVNPSEREEEPEEYIADTSCESVAAPNLGTDNKLIPVTINNSGEITKVNATGENWYDYCNKQWANAVILKDGETAPEENQKIEMDKIESMFVWIPKYKYRLWNVDVEHPLYNAHSIEIVFDTEDTTNIEGVSCKTPMNEENTQGLSGDIQECSNGEYMTHPAFISFGVDGLWVGKFETGYKDANSAGSANQSTGASTNIVVKPNEFSWRGLTVKNMFDVSKAYESTLQSHMMKNTEWGAVAYLSHSIYGINKEVTINNNDQYKTGYAALPSTDQSKYPGESGNGESFNAAWNTSDGYTASTTGNITGVYDMSGGAWEYVAAYVSEPQTNNSGFQIEDLSKLDEKYFDVYDKESALNSPKKKILGDATGELGPFTNYKDSDNNQRWHNHWYADYSAFTDTTHPWFTRGSNFRGGVINGQFNFGRNPGASADSGGFRLALAPANLT